MQNNSGSSLLLMPVGGFLFSLGLREFSWWCQVFYPIKIWIFIPPWVTKTPSGFGNWWICVFLKFWELRRSFGVKELWLWGDNKSCREAIPQAWSARKRGNYFKLEKGNMGGILGRNFWLFEGILVVIELFPKKPWKGSRPVWSNTRWWKVWDGMRWS